MKTFAQIWDAYVKKHPQFSNLDTKIQMPVGQLKSALELAYKEGYELGKSETPPNDMFSSIFGRK